MLTCCFLMCYALSLGQVRSVRARLLKERKQREIHEQQQWLKERFVECETWWGELMHWHAQQQALRLRRNCEFTHVIRSQQKYRELETQAASQYYHNNNSNDDTDDDVSIIPRAITGQRFLLVTTEWPTYMPIV